MAPMSIDRAVENAAVSLKMEGFNVEAEQKQMIKKIISGEISLQEALSIINRKYE